MRVAALLPRLFCLLAVYSWTGYPLALLFLRKLGYRRPASAAPFGPPTSVGVLVAARNEEAVIGGRIANILACKIHIPVAVYVVSDGSTDGTVETARSIGLEAIRVVDVPGGRGKTCAQNIALRRICEDVIVFTDADTQWQTDTLRTLIRAFDDSATGAAAGLLRWKNIGETAVTSAGGAYWRFELALWRLEHSLGLQHAGSGALLAVRRRLIPEMPESTGEDTLLPMIIAGLGYRVAFVEESVAFESRVESARAEFRSRVRMTIRGFDAFSVGMRRCLARRELALAWAIWSHKWMRWTSPTWGILAVASTFLVSRRAFVRLIVMGVVVSAAGWYGTSSRGSRSPILGRLGALVVVNAAFLKASFNKIFGVEIKGYVSPD